ncbi:MAG: ankyrin repeat domain-containing protein [Chlamydiales bacterium]|nr:ankyrin repeat domain-containing protein [Chlamydiales bacterium]
MAVTPIYHTEKLSALFVFSSQHEKSEKRIDALQERGWEVNKVCVQTLRGLANYLESSPLINMQVWQRFSPKIEKVSKKTLETICESILPGGILVLENGEQNTLKILAANCRPEVFVIGANTLPSSDNTPQCLGHLVQGMNATEIYYKTRSQHVQNIDVLQLEGLWNLLGKAENALPLCMRILGEEINLKTVKYLLGTTSIFVEDLEPFWQDVLKKMRDYEEDGDHFKSYDKPDVLRKLIPRTHRWNFFDDYRKGLDDRAFQRELDFGMNVLHCRPFEGAYLFVFSLAILDKYHPLISWLLEKLGDSEEIKMQLIHAISGLAIHPMPEQSVWKRMEDAITLVKTSYPLAEVQGTFDIWCHIFTRQKEYSLSSYVEILKELHSRQRLDVEDISTFRERILPLHNQDGQLRFLQVKNQLFHLIFFWPARKHTNVAEKIKNDNSLSLDDQLQFVCSLKEEKLVREYELLIVLVRANFFEAFPLFFSLIANQYHEEIYPEASPLHAAVIGKHTQSLKELLALQANPKIKDREKKTPLDRALILHWEEGAQILQDAEGITSPPEEEFGLASLYMG